MQMATFVEALRNDLESIAAVGDDPTAHAARRLTLALQSSAGLRLLDALGEVALEVSGQLPSGHVEVRLSGQDAELVYVREEEEEPAAPSGDDASARITLRLPEVLKTSVEAQAASEGVSVNTWIVRALTRSLSGGRATRGGTWGPRTGSRLTGFGRS
jgi:predicted DNA binding CopG/RHH family protein